MLTRRRLIAISAVAVLVPLRAQATPRLWTGQALGARASIRLDHPDGAAIAARVLAEIDRLENVLSLYRPESALSRLNRHGRLDAPPFELLDCLAVAGAVHHASGGRFDPTVQPLWALWAEAAAKGGRPAATARQNALHRTGWDGLRMDSTAITLRPGMALTLNGIGQGYVADRVAALLAAEGLDDILIDTGELRAIGGQPGGGGWPVQLAPQGQVALHQRALATSAPRGTTFDAAGLDGHVLDPHSGLPCPARWQAVSVSAPTAALADALSTAACLMPDRAAILDLLGRFNGARLEAATPA